MVLRTRDVSIRVLLEMSLYVSLLRSAKVNVRIPSCCTHCCLQDYRQRPDTCVQDLGLRQTGLPLGAGEEWQRLWRF